MTISIEVDEKVHLKFEGKINMSQEVVISRDDAKKLSDLLAKQQPDSFETE
jgi:hypothetical protein